MNYKNSNLFHELVTVWEVACMAEQIAFDYPHENVDVVMGIFISKLFEKVEEREEQKK